MLFINPFANLFYVTLLLIRSKCAYYSTVKLNDELKKVKIKKNRDFLIMIIGSQNSSRTTISYRLTAYLPLKACQNQNLSRNFTHCLSLSLSLSLTHTLPLTQTLFLSHTHTLSLSSKEMGFLIRDPT